VKQAANSTDNNRNQSGIFFFFFLMCHSMLSLRRIAAPWDDDVKN
jgi:hypothetical protein